MTHYIRLFPILVALMASFGVSPHARADGLDDVTQELPSDNRIRLMRYDPNDIYTLVTRVGYQTNVEFAEHEDIQTISVGDRSFWQIIPANNRLFIRPMQEGVATNMTIITNRHSYQFDLQSVTGKSHAIVYVARFLYPEDELKKSAAAARITPLQAMPAALPEPPAPVVLAAVPPPVAAPVAEPMAPLPPPKRNYLYTYSGADAAAPYEVFDDGVTTYFRYADNAQPAPSVAILAKDGHELALTVYTKDNYFAVDAVTSVLELKSGGARVLVYNETLSPAPVQP